MSAVNFALLSVWEMKLSCILGTLQQSQTTSAHQHGKNKSARETGENINRGWQEEKSEAFSQNQTIMEWQDHAEPAAQQYPGGF